MRKLIRTGKKGIFITVPIPERFWKNKDGTLNSERKIPSGIYNLYIRVGSSDFVLPVVSALIGKNIGYQGLNIWLLDAIKIDGEIIKVTVKIGDPFIFQIIGVLAALGITSLAISYMLVRIEKVIYISYPLLAIGLGAFAIKQVKGLK